MHSRITKFVEKVGSGVIEAEDDSMYRFDKTEIMNLNGSHLVGSACCAAWFGAEITAEEAAELVAAFGEDGELAAQRLS